MKRAVDGELGGQRFANIVTSPQRGSVESEQLANKPVAVTMYNGSHFTTPKMLEGSLRKEEINVTNAGTMCERLAALHMVGLAAGTFNEAWINVAQKQGFRLLIESHSTRSEAAGDEMDGPTLAAMFRTEAEAAALINAHPTQ